jgi:outer membrane protein assembly factor BamB
MFMRKSLAPTRPITALALAAAVIIPTLTASTAASAASSPAAGLATDTAYQISISHDGYSGDTTIAPPLTSRWTHSFTGLVSYPLIADGLVFVTVADVSSGYGTDLYALSQTDGSVVWSQFISGTYFWSNATYDNGQVFVVNYDGLMRAYSATTGTQNWSAQLPGEYAFSSPPTADGGVVYVGGAGGGGILYAVSETDGSVLWTEGVANGDNSSPALSSTSVFVSYACDYAYSFARATGQLQWATSPPCEGGGGKTPVYHNGLLYIRDAIQGNQILNATTGQEQGTFVSSTAPAFAGKTGLFMSSGTLSASVGHRTVWTFTGDGGLDTAPIVVGTTVYVGSSSGMVYGLNISKGKVVWSANAGSPINGPDEQNVSSPLTGLGAGQGLLVVPAGDQLAAYGG